MSDRTPNGQFRPGQSGNPAGRPKSESAALRERLAKEGNKIADTLIAAALGGDVSALKLVMDRIVPPLKPSAAPVELNLPASLTPKAIAETILRAAAAGEIPPDVAAQLVSAAGQFARIEELEELRQRMEALEAALKLRTKKKP